MKKRMVCLAAALLLCLFSALPAGAAAKSGTNSGANNPRVLDMAGLLSAEEERVLINRVNSIVEAHGFGVAIVTTASLEGTELHKYSERVFDGNGYGVGANGDGILFLISMEDRDWNIDVHGYGNTVFNEYGRERIGELVKPLLSDGDYAGAFSSFLDYVELFLKEAESGKPFGSAHPYLTSEDYAAYGVMVVVISLLVALVLVFVMRHGMKTVRPQPLANQYMRQGSFRLTGRNDIFLYRTVSKTKRVESSSGSSSSSSGGSGSHSHTSGKF